MNGENGKIVRCKVDENTSYIGKIVGESTIPQAVIGKGYIIECLDNFIPNIIYNYKYTVCYEYMTADVFQVGMELEFARKIINEILPKGSINYRICREDGNL